MIGRIPVAFLAGFISFLAPCVLPVVPGYLSAIAAVDPSRLDKRGLPRRVLVASAPFFLGFTILFVGLGAAAGALGGVLSPNSRTLQEISGFVLVVLGFAFMGLLPLPKRLVAPGMLGLARRRGSSMLLGGAFAVCAAPCVGPALASILLLAGHTSTAAEGSLLLLAYSLGLAVPFALAGIAFSQTMGAFRWLRDRYGLIQAASGAMLIALGLLLFFDRFWWLQVAFNRILRSLGLQGA